MKSRDDTRKDFSPASNTFLIVHGTPTKVKCLRCREWCNSIAVPSFTMYFCESIDCSNILELHQMKDGAWELHDYGASVEALLSEEHSQKLLVPPRQKFVPRVVK